jgi:hypothetical protein
MGSRGVMRRSLTGCVTGSEQDGPRVDHHPRTGQLRDGRAGRIPYSANSLTSLWRRLAIRQSMGRVGSFFSPASYTRAGVSPPLRDLTRRQPEAPNREFYERTYGCRVGMIRIETRPRMLAAEFTTSYGSADPRAPRQPAAVLHGMGGVGITPLALQYEHSFPGDYDLAVDAEQPELIVSRLLQAAEDRTPVAADHLACGQMPGGVLG